MVSQGNARSVVVPKDYKPDGEGRKRSCIEYLLEFQFKNSWDEERDSILISCSPFGNLFSLELLGNCNEVITKNQMFLYWKNLY